MLNLAPLSEADIGEIKARLGENPSRICENTAGVVFLWKSDAFDFYAVEGGTLYRATIKNGEANFAFPVGGDYETALGRIEEYCRRRGLKLRFGFLSERERTALEKRYAAVAESDRNWSDYLYLTDDLKNLRGKKYHGQKNHINKFEKSYPGYSFLPLDANLKSALAEFYEAYYESVSKDSENFLEEKEAFGRILDDYADYGFFGGALFAEGRIVAVSVGEIVGDTLYVHFEKALREYDGSYAMINHLFAARYGDAPYINREEDMGDAGLRKAKLDLHPVNLVKKYFLDAKL